MVIVGADGVGGPLLGGADRQMRAGIVSLFVPQRLTSLMSTDTTSALRSLTELVESNKMSPIIDRVFPLGDAAGAIRYLESGRALGKIVIAI